MQKLNKRKDFLAYMPNDLFVKMVTPAGDITLSVKEVIEQHLTEISKKPYVKNISYFRI